MALRIYPGEEFPIDSWVNPQSEWNPQSTLGSPIPRELMRQLQGQMLSKTRSKSLTARLPSRMDYLEFIVLGRQSHMHYEALSRNLGQFNEFNLLGIIIIILDNVDKFKLVGFYFKVFPALSIIKGKYTCNIPFTKQLLQKRKVFKRKQIHFLLRQRNSTAYNERA